MAPHFAYDVFLSYSSTDRATVTSLAEGLREAGLRVWFDQWSIRPGEDIQLAIERGLDTSRVLLLCMSQASMSSDWVRLEHSTTLFRDPGNRQRRFIPLLLEDCERPTTLQRFHHFDWRRPDDRTLEELVTVLRSTESDADDDQLISSVEETVDKAQEGPTKSYRPALAALLLLLFVPLAWFLSRPAKHPGEGLAESAGTSEDAPIVSTSRDPEPATQEDSPPSSGHPLPDEETSRDPLPPSEPSSADPKAPGSAGTGQDGDDPGAPSQDDMVYAWLEVPPRYERQVSIEIDGISVEHVARDGDLYRVAIPPDVYERGFNVRFVGEPGLPPLEKMVERPEAGQELRIKLTESDRAEPLPSSVDIASLPPVKQPQPGSTTQDFEEPTEPAIDESPKEEIEDPEPRDTTDTLFYVPSEEQLEYVSHLEGGSGNTLSTAPDAAFQSNYGLRVLLDGSTNAAFVKLRETHLRAESVLFTSLALNVDGLVLPKETDVLIMVAFDHKESYGAPIPVTGLRISESKGEKWLFMDVFDSAGELVSSEGLPMGTGWRQIYFEWQAGERDGTAILWTREPSAETFEVSKISGLETGIFNIDEARFGVLNVFGFGAQGHLDVDDIETFRVRQNIDGLELPQEVDAPAVPAPPEDSEP